MAQQLPYRYKVKGKEYSVLNNFTGGISTDYSDDIIKDSTYRQIENFDIIQGGMLEKRKGVRFTNTDHIADKIKTLIKGVDPVVDDTQIFEYSSTERIVWTIKYKRKADSLFYSYDVVYAKINRDNSIEDPELISFTAAENHQELRDEYTFGDDMKDQVTLAGRKYWGCFPAQLSLNAGGTTNRTNKDKEVLTHYVAEAYKGHVKDPLVWADFKLLTKTNIENWLKDTSTVPDLELWKNKRPMKPTVWLQDGVIFVKRFINIIGEGVYFGTADNLVFSVTTVSQLCFKPLEDNSARNDLIKEEVSAFNAGYSADTAKILGNKGYDIAKTYVKTLEKTGVTGEKDIIIRDDQVFYNSDRVEACYNDLRTRLSTFLPNYEDALKYLTEFDSNLIKSFIYKKDTVPYVEDVSVISPLAPAVGEEATIGITVVGGTAAQSKDPMMSPSMTGGIKPDGIVTKTNKTLWVNIAVFDADEYAAYNTTLQNGGTPAKLKSNSTKWSPVMLGILKPSTQGLKIFEKDFKIAFDSVEPKTLVVSWVYQTAMPTTAPDLTAGEFVTYNIAPLPKKLNIHFPNEMLDLAKGNQVHVYKGVPMFYGQTPKMYRGEVWAGHHVFVKGGNITKFNTDEPIINIQGFYDSMIAATAHKLFVVKQVQDGSTTTVELNKDIGVIAKGSMQNNLNTMFFLSYEGLFKLKTLYNYEDRFNVEKMDKTLASVFQNEIKNGAENALAVVSEDKYYIFFPTTGQCLIYYNTWSSWTTYVSDAFKGMNKVWVWEGKMKFTRDGSYNIHYFKLGDEEEYQHDLYTPNGYDQDTSNFNYTDWLRDTHDLVDNSFDGNPEIKKDAINLSQTIDKKEDLVYNDIWEDKGVNHTSDIVSIVKSKRLTFQGIMHQKKFKQLHLKTFTGKNELDMYEKDQSEHGGDIERIYVKINIDDSTVVDSAEWDFRINSNTGAWEYVLIDKPNIVTNAGNKPLNNNDNGNPQLAFEKPSTNKPEAKGIARIKGTAWTDVSGAGNTPFNMHKIIVAGKGLAIQYELTHMESTYIAISEIGTVYKTKKPKPRIYQSNKLYSK